MAKYGFVAIVATAVVVLDRVTKSYIDRTFDLYDSLPVIDGLFNITYLRNPGGAFGILAGHDAAWRLPFFIAVTALAVVVLAYFLRQVSASQPVLLFALSGILGGAIGNFIDRAVAGEVVDFLDFHWRGYHWPPFNVADSFITIGTAILLLHSLLGDRPPGERPTA